MPLTPEGWTVLKTCEGYSLSAYPDPASGGAPWTIGYGHTGSEVVPGLTISQEQAGASRAGLTEPELLAITDFKPEKRQRW